MGQVLACIRGRAALEVTEVVAERAWSALVPRGRSFTKRPSGGRFINPRAVEYRKREPRTAPTISMLNNSPGMLV